MNVLVRKEVRLLLPGFVAALALAIVPTWLWPEADVGVAVWLFCAGLVTLGALSFGREVGLKMLPWMLAQPVERKRIWRTKMAVLWSAMAAAFSVWLAAGSLFGLRRSSVEIEGCALVIATGVTGCLWLTLLLRQVVAAFWLSLLAPMGLAMAADSIFGERAVIPALAAYAVIGFFLARRQFLRAQDMAWSGGVVAFTIGTTKTQAANVRRWRPWAALVRKGIQLQQASLFGVASVLLLNITCAALRHFGAQTLSRDALFLLDSAPLLWLLAPVMIGCQSAADERKMGTMDLLSFLPVPRWWQWLVKASFAIVVGGLAAGALYLTSVAPAGALPASDSDWSFLLAFLALALLSFYASTLTPGLLQALAALALVGGAIWWVDVVGLSMLTGLRAPEAFGLQLFLCPFEAVALLWLSYRNFIRSAEGATLWACNAGFMAAVIVLVLGVETAMCDRLWELLMPLEPPHGTPRLSLAFPPVMERGVGPGLSVLLPDGRLWAGELGYSPRSFIMEEILIGGRWSDKWAGLPSGFERGSNWAAAAVTPSQTFALGDDGSLWASTNSEAAQKQIAQTDRSSFAPGVLAPVGNESDWQSMALDRLHRFLFLLKRNGTLWSRGAGNFYGAHPTVRSFSLQQISADSDWSGVIESEGPYMVLAWKTNGETWGVATSDKVVAGAGTAGTQWRDGFVMERVPSLDHQRWRCVVKGNDDFSQVALRDDGTLWSWNWAWEAFPPGRPRQWQRWVETSLTQIGADSNWAAVGSSFDVLATKTDGTLWKLREENSTPATLASPPRWSFTRWSDHHDWVGVSSVSGGFVTLSADGGLWHWPNLQSPRQLRVFDGQRLIGQSRRPQLVANLFDTKSAAGPGAAPEANP